MASRTGKYKTAAGNVVEFIRKKQGRKPSPPELVKVPLTIYVLPATKEKIERGAMERGLSVSEYGETAIILYDYGIYHCSELVIQ